jgi:hypothetical protein
MKSTYNYHYSFVKRHKLFLQSCQPDRVFYWHKLWRVLGMTAVALLLGLLLSLDGTAIR